jgi:hypothetical protein
MGLNCIYLATIYSFVLQNLTQHVHRTSWYFRNGSQSSIDSRHGKFSVTHFSECSRHSSLSLASSMPGFLVYFNLEAIQQFVEAAKKIYY